MMLSPLSPKQLDNGLQIFGRLLENTPGAGRAFRRIAETRFLCPNMTADLFARHDQAVALARLLGMATVGESPAQSFSWDGSAVRTQTETAVLLHEIAHWQIAPPERCRLTDFGLGAGPETRLKVLADAACCVDDETREWEEDLASLLGIL